MRPSWLEEDIAAHLDLANAWLTRSDGTSNEEWAGIYESTGSCLRVFVDDRSQHHRLRIAQGTPLVLSDGSVAISAVLSPGCLQTPLEPGHTLALSRYSILYTPYGPLRECLSLTLYLAHLHDEHDGRLPGPLGDIKSIHLSDKVVAALRSLQQTLAKFDRTRFGSEESVSKEASKMRAHQDKVNALVEDASPSTQAAYGTQMVDLGQGLTETAQQLQGASGNQNDFEKQKAALIGLLNDQGGQRPMHPGNILASEQSRTDGESIPSKPQAAVLSQPDTGFPIQADSVCNVNLHTKTTMALSAGGFKKSVASCQTAGSAARLESKFQPTHMPPLYQGINNTKIVSNPLAANGPVAANARASEDRMDRTPLANSQALDPIPTWLADTCRANGCGTVPTAQKKLLSSWQKRRIGTNDRFPDANVPIHVLKALKRFEIGTELSDDTSSDEGASTASEDNVPVLDEALSESDDDTALSWSASPIERSPRRPFRSNLSLPPDSSLNSMSAGSRSDPQEASPDHGATHIVALESIEEKNIAHSVSSPSRILDDNDSDIEMELDLPRGLDENDTVHGAAPSARTQQTKGIIQVKETPLGKNKNTAPLSVPDFSAQPQQQHSSGTSKDTSSTSVVFSTYNDSSSHREVVADLRTVLSKTVPSLSLPEDHQDLPTYEDEHRPYSRDVTPVGYAQKDDVCMEEPGEGLQSSSSPSDECPQHERQETHYHASSSQIMSHKTTAVGGSCRLHEGSVQTSPPSSPGLSLPDSSVPTMRERGDGDQYGQTNRYGSFASPKQSPTSVQIVQSSTRFNGEGRIKRKMGDSPSTNGRRPLKRRDIKLVQCYSNSPSRDYDADLRREKEEHMRKFAERQRAQSVLSVRTDDDSASEAESGRVPNQNEGSPKTAYAPPSAQSYSARSTTASVAQSPQDNHKRKPRFSASEEQKTRCENMAVNRSEIPDLGKYIHRTVAIEAHIGETMGGNTNDNELGTGDPVFDTKSICNDPEDFDVEEMAHRTAVKMNYKTTNSPRVEQTVTDHIASRHEETDSPRGEDVHTPTSKSARSGSPRTDMRLSPSAIVFETFKRAYPLYPGNERQFLGQCKNIDKLDQQDKMVPKWQWDDFIVRYQTDYRGYADQCLNNGEDPEPYYRFYKDNFQDTLFQKCIIQSRKTLLTAITELESRTAGGATVENPSALDSGAIKEVGMNGRASSNVETQTSQHINVSPEPSRTRTTARKAPVASVAKLERVHPSLVVQKKARQSLPSAFNKQTERAPRASSTLGNRPRQSLPGYLNRGGNNQSSSSAKDPSAPTKDQGRETRTGDASARASPHYTASSSRPIPAEPTGDPYRDFIFAHSRITSLTGSGRIDSDARKEWPKTLRPRPKAEMKREGYDVLRWSDDV